MDSCKSFHVYLHVQICSLRVYKEERAVDILTWSVLHHVWLQSAETCCDVMSEVWLHFVFFFSCSQFFLIWCGPVETMETEDLTWIDNMGKVRSKEMKEKGRQVKAWETLRHAPEGEEYCLMLPSMSPPGHSFKWPPPLHIFLLQLWTGTGKESYARIKWSWKSFCFWSNPSKTGGIKDSHWTSMAIGWRHFWLLSIIFCYSKNVMGPAWRKVDCLHRASRNVTTNGLKTLLV